MINPGWCQSLLSDYALQKVSKKGALESTTTISELFPIFFLVKLERNPNLVVIETEETIKEMKVSGVYKRMEDKNSKERILSSARDLFQRYGIRSITMDDIAHHLGISKKTIYQHFSDKDDIVTLSMKHHIGTERDAILQLKQQAKDALDLLIRIHHYLQKNLTHSTSALLFDLQKYHAKAWAMMNEFKYGFVADFVKSNLEAGIEQGLFRDDINVEIVTKIRLEEIMLAHNDSVFPRDKFSSVEVSGSILEHFIFAITTDRGRKLYKKYREVNNKNGIYKTHEV